jgi:16S rRNA (cytosine967-C5)-methyltransferase
MPGSKAGDGTVPDNQPSDHDGFFYAVLQKSALDAPARRDS